ncbi:MAG: hypothetical protein JWN94_2619 [Betaproteobacteria bacterium]|nr:hypothetical protein [Betaproteobacteria bacterium]
MTGSAAESEQQQSPASSNDDSLWHAFATATTSDVFCRAWLALLCRQLPQVSAAVVLLEAENARTFVPIAVWPEPVRDLSHLGKVAERALSEARGIVDVRPDTFPPVTQIAYPIVVAARTVGAVTVEASTLTEAEVKTALRQLHWASAWLTDIFQRRELHAAVEASARVGSVMETIATALRPGKLQQVLFEIANHVCRHLNCSRAGLGLVDAQHVRVAVLSDAAWIETKTGLVRHYTAAMEETFDRRASIVYALPAQSDPSTEGAQSAHAQLAIEVGAIALLSTPLLFAGKCIGVLTLERTTGDGFSAAEIAWIEALAALLPAVIDQRRRAESGYVSRLKDDFQRLGERLFGPRYLVWKFGTALLIISIAMLTLVEIEYRVTAKTVIEGEIQRVAAAPFEGFVAVSHARAGDTVKEGQVLIELDDRDLKIEQAKWSSERDQYERKLREAMANHDMTQVQVIGAQLKQSEAQLNLATEKINRAKICSPYDGVVVSGDLSQQIGSPVETGKKLLEIAPLQSYRVILQVDEREIRHVETGQTGKLVISGIAGDAVPFVVSKVTPVAIAQDGRNFFRVEARLEHAPTRLRPGMEGVGKINTADNRLWWILTHSFTDWLRLTLWNWLP